MWQHNAIFRDEETPLAVKKIVAIVAEVSPKALRNAPGAARQGMF